MGLESATKWAREEDPYRSRYQDLYRTGSSIAHTIRSLDLPLRGAPLGFIVCDSVAGLVY